MTWNDTVNNCTQLLFPPEHERVFRNISSTRNKSYWLAIHKNDTCKTRLVKEPKVMALNECPYVKDSNDAFGNCDMKYHPVCIKPGTSDDIHFQLETCLLFGLRELLLRAIKTRTPVSCSTPHFCDDLAWARH